MKTHNEDEKKIAKKAQQTLEEMLLHKIVYLKNISTEKYGRLLADVYYDEIHINQLMLDNRYAVKYNGGTKISPSSWTKYYEIGEL
jgi:endonuclease YncB( thermonuclease family)